MLEKHGRSNENSETFDQILIFDLYFHNIRRKKGVNGQRFKHWVVRGVPKISETERTSFNHHTIILTCPKIW